MKVCPFCNNEVYEEEMICPTCGYQFDQQQQNQYIPNAVQEDKVSVWLVVLSFLIPLVGFIYWGVKKKDRPKNANACGIAGLIGFVINFLLMYAEM